MNITMRKRSYLLLTSFMMGLLAAILLSACGNLMSVTPTPLPTNSATLIPSPHATATSVPLTSIPTSTAIPSTAPLPTRTPTPTVVPDTGWELLQPGLERRVINLFDLFDDKVRHIEQIYLLRLEPAQFRFDVAYDAQGKSLEGWQTEREALIVVNGGFFRLEEEEFIANGLMVLNGKPIGASFGDFAGMLAITESGPEIRWLAHTPYNPEEPLLGALQSFPMLVKPGGVLGFAAEHEDGKQARRTVIGQDEHGRVLFLVASFGYFTLHQLSLYLTESDLELDVAVNLDGGPSSGLRLAQPLEEVPAFSFLPIVITVSAH